MPDIFATYAAEVQTRLVGPVVMTVGATIAIIASFAPWLRSGSITRSSYDLIGLVHLLQLSHHGQIRLLIRLWPVMPLLVVAGVVAAWWGRRFIAAGFGLVGGLYAGVPSAAIARSVHDHYLISVTGAPMWTAVGASLVVLGSLLVILVRVPSAHANAR